MGMLGMLGDAVKGGISGGLTGGISGAISNGIGSMIGGLFGPSQKELQQQQLDYQGKLMALQQTYNRMQADYTHQLSKDMWDYTNYENQVKHLKTAGLNPALFYGKGGAQGASTSGGSAAPVSTGSPIDPYMSLNYRKLNAETMLTEAQAAKTREEAKKISGPDTEKIKQDIETAKEQIEAIKAGIAKTEEETKLAKFNNWINDIKKNAQYNGRSVTIVDSFGNQKEYTEYDNFETAIAKQMAKQMEKDGIELDKESQELLNKKHIAEELGQDIQTLVGVEYAKMNQEFEKSEQARTQTSRDKWELEQDQALSKILDKLANGGEYARLLTAIIKYLLR